MGFYPLVVGVHKPEFPYPRPKIGVKFNHPVLAGGRGRKYLDNQIRGSVAAPFVNLGRVADHNQIGLHHGVITSVFLGIKPYPERRDKGLAGFAVQEVRQFSEQSAGYPLVQGKGRGHLVDNPVYYLRPEIFIPFEKISIGILFFFFF
jgi:hypothetical protein